MVQVALLGRQLLPAREPRRESIEARAPLVKRCRVEVGHSAGITALHGQVVQLLRAIAPALLAAAVAEVHQGNDEDRAENDQEQHHTNEKREHSADRSGPS